MKTFILAALSAVVTADAITDIDSLVQTGDELNRAGETLLQLEKRLPSKEKKTEHLVDKAVREAFHHVDKKKKVHHKMAKEVKKNLRENKKNVNAEINKVVHKQHGKT
jgi:hypothetical protein